MGIASATRGRENHVADVDRIRSDPSRAIALKVARILWLVALVAFLATMPSRARTVADDRAARGIAFDEIIEAQPNAPTFPPSTFEHDFQVALHPTMSCEAWVLRRYMTVDRERIDDSCRGVTLIIDCKARTVLQTYRQSKAYGITSFDATPDPEYAAAIAKERRMRASMPKIGNVVVEERLNLGADRYRVVRRQTLTDSGPVGVLFTRETMTYAFSNTRLPELHCIDDAAPYIAQLRPMTNSYMPELPANYAAAQARAASLAQDESTESGPTLPRWRLVSLATGDHFQSQSRAATFTNYFKIESGHIRSIANDDPIFNAPAGYSKVSR
jgi:hypothetical protein